MEAESSISFHDQAIAAAVLQAAEVIPWHRRCEQGLTNDGDDSIAQAMRVPCHNMQKWFHGIGDANKVLQVAGTILLRRRCGEALSNSVDVSIAGTMWVLSHMWHKTSIACAMQELSYKMQKRFYCCDDAGGRRRPHSRARRS